MLQAIDTATAPDLLPPAPPAPVVQPATVVEPGGDLARVCCEKGGEVAARIALPGPAELFAGDRVLVAGDGDRVYVIGVLDRARSSPAVVTRDGAAARLVEEEGRERLEVRDRRGRLLFEYDPESGRGALSVPAGDLELRAPEGRIDLQAGRGIRLESPRMSLEAERAEVDFSETVYRGERLSATLNLAELFLGKLATTASRILEKARDVYREVEKLHQLKAGRARELVSGSHYVKARRTYHYAEGTVKIDGQEIHLG